MHETPRHPRLASVKVAPPDNPEPLKRVEIVPRAETSPARRPDGHEDPVIVPPDSRVMHDPHDHPAARTHVTSADTPSRQKIATIVSKPKNAVGPESATREADPPTTDGSGRVAPQITTAEKIRQIAAAPLRIEVDLREPAVQERPVLRLAETHRGERKPAMAEPIPDATVPKLTTAQMMKRVAAASDSQGIRQPRTETEAEEKAMHLLDGDQNAQDIPAAKLSDSDKFRNADDHPTAESGNTLKQRSLLELNKRTAATAGITPDSPVSQGAALQPEAIADHKNCSSEPQVTERESAYRDVRQSAKPVAVDKKSPVPEVRTFDKHGIRVIRIYDKPDTPPRTVQIPIRQDEALKHVLGVDYEDAVRRLYPRFEIQPYRGRNGMIHILGGDMFQDKQGKRALNGGHHEPSIGPIWSKLQEGKEGTSSQVILKPNGAGDMYPGDPYKGYQLTVGGVPRLIKETVDGQTRLVVSKFSLFPQGYTPFQVLNSVVLAVDERNPNNDVVHRRSGIRICRGDAILLDGKGSMRIKAILNNHTQQIRAAWILMEESFPTSLQEKDLIRMMVSGVGNISPARSGK